MTMRLLAEATRSKECIMHRLSLAGLVTTAFIAAAALVPGPARAVPLASTPGSLATIDTSNGVEQVHYVRRRYYPRRSYRYRYYGPSFGLYYGNYPRRYYPRRYYPRRSYRYRYYRRW